MLDANLVAVSPASVWRVLHQAGLLSRWNGKPSGKGKGFQQPLGPHQHWHVDISYISGTFYYLCSVLEGYSRFLVHWEIRESMTEAEVEIILQCVVGKLILAGRNGSRLCGDATVPRDSPSPPHRIERPRMPGKYPPAGRNTT